MAGKEQVLTSSFTAPPGQPSAARYTSIVRSAIASQVKWSSTRRREATPHCSVRAVFPTTSVSSGRPLEKLRQQHHWLLDSTKGRYDLICGCRLICA